ncbi:hypothetical protein [Methylobacterium sp. Leaf88]|uniref:hypothetical protein n=1 Tax=Methylobacterium sp. Leaf88 TaxID=1736244 RepID=UPI0006FB9F6D|nr:hypothetical protein [Methylobacterium sp. Leaf88]KQO70591.1 hypothetical protein ASF20_18975 [Methylobacterium sp. Leaf88]
MFLSEAEAEAALRDLRRRRDELDRAIADHQLYLELGRRLRPIGPAPAAEAETSPPGAWDAPARPPAAEPASLPEPVFVPGLDFVSGHGVVPGQISGPGQAEPARAGEDLVAARRHGRALVAAAVNLLHEAGRPLHAGEIWQGLTALGFALPGHDPVAALNTRLWKRSGPGGPLKRLGEAVYAPSEEDDDLG